MRAREVPRPAVPTLTLPPSVRNIVTKQSYRTLAGGIAQVMFPRTFAGFDPGPDEVAHVLLALAQGLAAQETAGWLGTSRASMDRRWDLAIRAALRGIGAGDRQGQV